jgi:hypothetical protein
VSSARTTTSADLAPEEQPGGTTDRVTELRVSITVSDFEKLRTFYPDTVGLPDRLALAVPDAPVRGCPPRPWRGRLLAEARPTPWGDVNARTQPPEGPQLTVFSPPAKR